MKKMTFSSPTHRMIAYFTFFAVGAALFELIRPLFPRGFFIHAFVFIAIFALAGFLIIHNNNLTSRITSASILFMLASFAITFGADIPSAYNLLLIIFIAWAGSRAFLHKKQKNILTTILLAISTVFTAIAMVAVYVIIASWLMRLAIATMSCS